MHTNVNPGSESAPRGIAVQRSRCPDVLLTPRLMCPEPRPVSGHEWSLWRFVPSLEGQVQPDGDERRARGWGDSREAGSPVRVKVRGSTGRRGARPADPWGLSRLWALSLVRSCSGAAGPGPGAGGIGLPGSLERRRCLLQLRLSRLSRVQLPGARGGPAEGGAWVSSGGTPPADSLRASVWGSCDPPCERAGWSGWSGWCTARLGCGASVGLLGRLP